MKAGTLVAIGMIGIVVAACALPCAAYAKSEAVAAKAQGQGNTPSDEPVFTPEQQQKLQDIQSTSRAKIKELTESMKAKRDALDKELSSASATRASVAPLISELKSLEAQFLDERVNRVFAIKEALTAEQFAVYLAKAAERKAEVAAGKVLPPAVGKEAAATKK